MPKSSYIDVEESRIASYTMRHQCMEFEDVLPMTLLTSSGHITARCLTISGAPRNSLPIYSSFTRIYNHHPASGIPSAHHERLESCFRQSEDAIS